MNNKKKPIIRWPGDTRLLDGTQPVIFAGPAIALGIIGFLFCMALSLWTIWHNLPGLPVPTSEKEPLFHVFAFFAMWAGKFLPFLQGNTYHDYLNTILKWTDSGEGNLFAIRWLFAIIIGSLGGVWLFLKAWTPINNERQIRGRVLLEGNEAFNDLKKEFDTQIFATKLDGLILSSNKGFSPIRPSTFDEKTVKVIKYPDQQRRTHFIFLGGSRRGKGVLNKQHVVQVYGRIKAGDKQKMLVIDTPKGEYANLIDPDHMMQIAPDEKHSVKHWLSRDLALAQDAQRFWAGKIPENEKDPFWTKSSGGIGTGISVFLQREAGEDWSYNNLAYWKDQSPEVLEPLLKKYYPEVNQILNMGQQPLGSVLGTLAGFTQDINDLARVWDGYDYKHGIHQMSAAMLQRQFWVEWFTKTAYPAKAMLDGAKVDIPYNQHTSSLITGMLGYLNSQSNPWKWTDLKALLLLPFDEQLKIIKDFITVEEKQLIDRAYISQHFINIQPILEYAEIWDDYEARPKLSIRDWATNESPDKKVLMLKPSGRFKNQSEGIIRGILYFMTGIINDKYFPDDSKTNVRNFHIFCDEFQSLGNMKDFIAPGLEMFASKGITIYLSCQDLSQLKSVYGEDFLNFLQGNTGNIFIMGTNQGATAEMISNLVGKKTIMKMHTSQSFQQDGRSSSINFQEHEGVVITPDEVNSKLGTKPLPGGKYEVHAMYLPGNMTNAYILTFPVVKYETLYTPKAPDWMTGKLLPPAKVNRVKVIEGILGSTGGKKQFTDETPNPEPELEELQEENIYEMTEEEMLAMEQATKREETKPLYRLPKEQEDMQGEIAKDVAVDILGGGLLSAVKHLSEIVDGSHSNVTSSKKKYLKAWTESKEHKDKSQ